MTQQIIGAALPYIESLSALGTSTLLGSRGKSFSKVVQNNAHA
jgi:hypothetical protein